MPAKLVQAFAGIALMVALPSVTNQWPVTANHPQVMDSRASRAYALASKFPDRSIPIRLYIPSLKVRSSIIQLGLQKNGQVEVPKDTKTVGWFRYGVTPGQLGAAVLLAHVDSYVGPAVFFNLKKMKVGAFITVTLLNGQVAQFQVKKVATYFKRSFPSLLVYTANGKRELNLVTCGGVFDRKTRSYQSNVVVFSTFSKLIQ